MKVRFTATVKKGDFHYDRDQVVDVEKLEKEFAKQLTAEKLIVPVEEEKKQEEKGSKDAK